MPYLEYAFNKEYIAENLCENNDKPELHCEGKCHLTKELVKASEKEEDPTAPISPNKSEVKLLWFYQNSLIVTNPLYEDGNQNQILYRAPFFAQTHVEITTPPPEFTLC